MTSRGWPSWWKTYASLPLGTTDASVIAVAERLNLAEVATLDRRHFTCGKTESRGRIDACALSHYLKRAGPTEITQIRLPSWHPT